MNKLDIDHRAALIILLLAVILAYANSVFGTFVWDDQTLIVRNGAVKSFANLPFIFSNEFAGWVKYRGGVYRPLQELSYMTDHFVYGVSPAGYHITGMLFHAGCVLALYFVILALGGARSAAFLSALIFGLHPINTEAVAYISGRSDPMYLFFLLVSFLLYIRSDGAVTAYKKAGYFALSVLLFIPSLLSRETAMVFPVILAAYELCRPNRKTAPDAALRVLVFAVIAAGFIALRSGIVHSAPVSHRTPIFGTGLPLISAMLVKYLGLMAFPVGLHMMHYADMMKTVVDRDFAMNMMILIALGAAVAVAIRKDRKLLFWLAWFIIFISPHLTAINLNALFAEHWAYGASIGIYVIFSTALLAAMSRFRLPARTAYAVLAGIAVYLSALTIMRNADWKDEPSIYNNTLKYGRYAKVFTNLGVYYEQNGQYDKSLEAHKEALRLAPRNPLYHKNIAAAYEGAGDTASAVRHLETSLEFDPTQSDIRERLEHYGK